MNGIDNDMSVNGLCVRVRCDHALAIREGFFRIGFGILLYPKRISMVCTIRGEFEMIILSLVVIRIFPKPRRRFFELSRIVLVYEKVLHVDVFRLIIKKLNEAGIKCTALTKGLLPIELSELSHENEYGITLISLNEKYREETEPGAAPYLQRIAALESLHNQGCRTWVSVEPYPTPNIIEQDFEEILQAISFTDKIIFGRLNYNKRVTEYKGYKEYFNKLAYRVIEFCESTGKQYHIKTGTLTEE